jgi:hypothetical protein
MRLRLKLVSEARADNLVSRRVTGVKRHCAAFELIVLHGTATPSTSIFLQATHSDEVYRRLMHTK